LHYHYRCVYRRSQVTPRLICPVDTESVSRDGARNACMVPPLIRPRACEFRVADSEAFQEKPGDGGGLGTSGPTRPIMSYNTSAGIPTGTGHGTATVAFDGDDSNEFPGFVMKLSPQFEYQGWEQHPRTRLLYLRARGRNAHQVVKWALDGLEGLQAPYLTTSSDLVGRHSSTVGVITNVQAWRSRSQCAPSTHPLLVL